MSSARKKEIKRLVALAEEQGWTVEVRRTNHLCFKAPDGESMVFAPATPSDHRSMKNVRAQLRREGLEDPTC